VVISGDTQGWIVPCGCTSNQSGGLLRRGDYLRQLRAGHDVLYLDAGGAAAGNSPYQAEKLKAIFAGEVAMGIAAHNLGGSEIALGSQCLRDLAAATHVPLLSVNAHPDAGPPLAPPMRIFSVNGRRLGVVGVVSPRYAAADISVDDPQKAILAATQAFAGRFDSLLVLAYLPDDELEQLAQSLPEADVIVGGPTVQSIVPRRVGMTLLASATNKGKFLVRLDPPDVPAGQWSGEIVELGPAFNDDPVQAANLARYLDDLRRRDFSAAESGFAPALPVGMPADYRVAGNAACAACHHQAEIIWVHSLHAQAGPALAARHFDFDPDCLRCHTTGYGLPGGFISPNRTPHLFGVGCEDCHGPSEAHAADPSIHTAYAASDQCTRCHDEENSPKFNSAVYWQKIKHGRARASQ